MMHYKKTQRSLGNNPNQGSTHIHPQKVQWLDIGLCVIIALLVVTTIFVYYPKIKSLITTQHPVASKIDHSINKKTFASLSSQQKLILNGIFLSNQEKIALINNKTLRVGDMIEGKKVTSIDLDRVKLQDETGILILSSTS